MERIEMILDGLDVSHVERQESADSESDVTLFCDGVVFKSSTSTNSRFYWWNQVNSRVELLDPGAGMRKKATIVSNTAVSPPKNELCKVSKNGTPKILVYSPIGTTERKERKDQDIGGYMDMMHCQREQIAQMQIQFVQTQQQQNIGYNMDMMQGQREQFAQMQLQFVQMQQQHKAIMQQYEEIIQ